MSIPADTRTFGLRGAMLATASFCVSLAVFPYLPTYGFSLPVAVTAFWLGMGLFIASDAVDNGPIDSRKATSQILNIAGMLVVISAMLVCVLCLLANFATCWLFRGL